VTPLSVTPLSVTPGVPLIEILAAIAAAGDLTMGQPTGHSLRGALLAREIARASGASQAHEEAAVQTTLLRWSGCSATAPLAHELLGDDITARAQLLAESSQPVTATPEARAAFAPMSAAHCDVAQRIATRIGTGEAVVAALDDLFERWDGNGLPRGDEAEGIALAARLAVLAGDAEVLVRVHGHEPALAMLTERAGRTYDPALVAVAAEAVVRWLALLDEHDAYDLLRAAADGWTRADSGRTGDLLRVLGDFADLKVPALAGHTGASAILAATSAELVGVDDTLVLHAALVHDIGRAGVSNAVWERQGALRRSDREAIELHPYHSYRCVRLLTGFDDVAATAALHHERLDGRGYHRQLPGSSQPLAGRLLAVADRAAAMVADRPYRPALDLDEVARVLRAEAADGVVDAQCVAAVLDVLGAGRAPVVWPADLTPREVDVLRLLARGLTNGAAARRLRIAEKTVGRHAESLYAKLGVNNRAALTYEALRRNLLTPLADGAAAEH
jgi:HD-GYP domain-containing protein (c-di-GMP phosphodiesterase class II)/DNA-binding CsgD family transcriptional regulator